MIALSSRSGCSQAHVELQAAQRAMVKVGTGQRRESEEINGNVFAFHCQLTRVEHEVTLLIDC
jgi:hypothetical protein